MSEGAPVRTALYDEHVALNANLVDFHGFELPIWYSNIKQEHLATRASAGLFDVSHMLGSSFKGKDAVKFVESITVADVKGLADGTGTLSVVTNDDGTKTKEK